METAVAAVASDAADTVAEDELIMSLMILIARRSRALDAEHCSLGIINLL